MIFPFARAKIKVGMLISYDFAYLFDALPLLYPHVDQIVLALDVSRRTWTGGSFELPDDFYDRVAAVDPSRKIVFLEQEFYRPELSPIQNETRERNILSQFMGERCWKIQVDVDEYFVDFAQVAGFLQRHRYLLHKPKWNSVNLRGRWITLFKRTPNGFLYVDNDEDFSFATNLTGAHFFGRDLDGKHNREFATGFEVIHQSWAREPDEIYQKIHNWGHANDFDVDAYFTFWNQVSEDNYTEFQNLHPVYPGDWKRLHFIACDSVSDFCRKYHQGRPAFQSPRLPSRFWWKFLKNAIKPWKR